tara:strand:+ start:6496 stop:7314 length:819 start_codon:yes stop_codon:yes gene_type:complete
MVKPNETAEYIVNWLKSYINNTGLKGFVVGVSGGIDSAVVSTLCSMTGFPVTVMEMPIHQAKDQVSRGKNHIDSLKERFSNVSSMELDLTETYDDFVRALEKVADLNADVDNKFLTLSNTRSRLRMISLYSVAGLNGYLVCGTGNKVEDFGVGFYTKYGDGGVDISPIADLMKSEVYQLGKAIGVNDDILTARPTDGLWDDGRTDEDQIGATYDELEWAMLLQDKHGSTPNDTVFENERQKKVWEIYLERHKANKHKMDPIPVCEIPDKFRA